MGRICLKSLLLALLLLVVLAAASFGFSRFFVGSSLTPGYVLVVPLEGVLAYDHTSSFLARGSISSKEIVATLEDAGKDPSVRAVILEINSPGGTVVASEEIASAVSRLDVPVYAVVHDVAASGAYWVASACDVIVVSPMSIVGSIGVISSYLEFSDLFEKYGVSYERLVAGEMKDVGTPYRSLNSSEREFLQKKLDLIHAYFVASVAAQRHMSEEDVWPLANGAYFLGTEALDLGLVDKLGTRQDAFDLLKKELGVSDIRVVEEEPAKGLFDYFTQAHYALGYGLGDALLTRASPLPAAM